MNIKDGGDSKNKNNNSSSDDEEPLHIPAKPAFAGGATKSDNKSEQREENK